MEVKSLLGNMGKNLGGAPAAQTTKEASAPPAENPALQAAMNGVLAAVNQTKTASAGENLGETLTKEAQLLAAADDEVAVRRAKLAGTAFAESALSSFDRAGQAADALIKSAAEGLDPRTIQLAKMAQEDPERFMREVQAGIAARQGSTDPARDRVRQVHKIATDHYLAGYESLRKALSAA